MVSKKNKRELRLYQSRGGHWVVTDGDGRIIKTFIDKETAMSAMRRMQVDWPFPDKPKPAAPKRKRRK